MKESENYYYNYLHSVAPPGLLTTPVYINLTLLPCTHGFHLTGSPPGCDGVPVLVKFGLFSLVALQDVTVYQCL